MPQKPEKKTKNLGQLVLDASRLLGCLVPFISVIRSARCMARIREKWPVSEERRSFCLSYAVVAGVEMSALLFLLCLPRGERDSGDRNVHDTCPAFWAPPLVAADEVLLDMAAALAVGDVVGVGGGRECSCGVEGRFLAGSFVSVV